MVDCKGNELRIGDEVVFVKGKNSSASLDTGIVTKFYKNYYEEDECSVQYYCNGKLVSQSHLPSFRVIKTI